MADFDGELRVVYTPATQPGEVTVVSTEAVTEAESARDAAQAARDQAVAAAGTFTAPADTVIGALVADDLSETGLAVQARVNSLEVTKAAVGLGNVDNTADAAKPVSALQQAALNLKADDQGLTRGKAATKYRMVSCCLRRVDGATWAVLEDSGHSSTGVSSVTITSTYVQVNFDFTALKVSSWQNTVDDGFAAPDVRCGASVGLTYARIFFYMGAPGTGTPVAPGTLSTAGANVWVTGFFEVA